MSWQLIKYSLHKNIYQLALSFDLVITLHQNLDQEGGFSWKLVAEPFINKQWSQDELCVTDIIGAQQKAIDNLIECLQSLCLLSFNHRPKPTFSKNLIRAKLSGERNIYQLENYRVKEQTN